MLGNPFHVKGILYAQVYLPYGIIVSATLAILTAIEAKKRNKNG